MKSILELISNTPLLRFDGITAHVRPIQILAKAERYNTALVPGIYDPKLADEQVEVGTDDAHQMVVRLAREEGLLVGVSSEGNMVAAIRVAEKLKAGGREDAVVVTIFCDSAAKYLSDSSGARLTTKRRTGRERNRAVAPD
jgi:cysteine synthase